MAWGEHAIRGETIYGESTEVTRHKLVVTIIEVAGQQVLHEGDDGQEYQIQPGTGWSLVFTAGYPPTIGEAQPEPRVINLDGKLGSLDGVVGFTITALHKEAHARTRTPLPPLPEVRMAYPPSSVSPG